MLYWLPNMNSAVLRFFAENKVYAFKLDRISNQPGFRDALRTIASFPYYSPEERDWLEQITTRSDGLMTSIIRDQDRIPDTLDLFTLLQDLFYGTLAIQVLTRYIEKQRSTTTDRALR